MINLYFIFRSSDGVRQEVRTYLLSLFVGGCGCVFAATCVSTWKTMPSVCLYSDREIALSLLTHSLCISGQLCVRVCVRACVCEDETVIQ